MPDAHMGATLDGLAGAGFGGAGQRCTALSAVVFVGGSKPWYFNLFIYILYNIPIYLMSYLYIKERLLFGCVLFYREEKLVERVKSLKVNVGTDPDADLGPVTNKIVSTCT